MTIKSPPPFWLTIAFLVGVGGFLRLVNLGGTDLWYDEVAMIYHGRYFWEMFQSGIGFVDMPLFPLLMRLLDRLGAHSEFALRLVPWAFGTGTLVLVDRIAARMFADGRARIWSVTLAAFSPFLIYYSQELRVYAVECFLVSLALLLGFDIERRPWLALPLGLTWTAAMYSHTVIDVVVVMHMATLLALHWTSRAARGRLLRTAIAACLVFAVYLPPLYLGVYHLTVRVKWFYHPLPTLKTQLISLVLWIYGYGVDQPEVVVFAVVWVIVLTFGLTALPWRSKEARSFASTLILPYATVVGVSYVIPNSAYLTRYFIYMVPLLMVLAGGGIAALFQDRRTRTLATLAAVTLALSLLPSLANHYANRMPNHLTLSPGVRPRVQMRAPAEFIRARYSPGDLVVHTCRSSHIPLERYYLEGIDQFFVSGSPEFTAFENAAFPMDPSWFTTVHQHIPLRTLTAELPGAERVWVVYSYWDLEYENDQYHKNETAVRKIMGEWGVVEDFQSFDGSTVVMYDKRS